MGKLVFALTVFIMVGAISCNSDPFDPMIGPRNPEPGAAKYLERRSDIQIGQKDCLLNNEPCDIEVLRILSDAPSPEVRSLVATNPSVTTDVLAKLSKDNDVGVRTSVAVSGNTPREILLALLSDPNSTVRWAVPANKNLAVEDVVKLYESGVADPVQLARNNKTPIYILKKIAKLNDYNANRWLSNNESINDEISNILISYKQKSALNGLIYNNNVSISVLTLLTENEDIEISEKAKEELNKRSSK
jgi:hypothetical protein